MAPDKCLSSAASERSESGGGQPSVTSLETLGKYVHQVEADEEYPAIGRGRTERVEIEQWRKGVFELRRPTKSSNRQDCHVNRQAIA